MVKKIIHASDIHLPLFKLHSFFKTQLQKFIDDVKEKVDGYNHNEIRIVLTGDIVDQKINMTNELSMLMTWFFKELSRIGVVVILPGNHDFLVNNQERIDSLSPTIRLLNAVQRHTDFERTGEFELNKDNDIIKYFKDGGVYPDDNIKWVVYSLYQNNTRPQFTKEDGLYVGLFHGQIQGLVTDLGFKFDDGYDVLNFVDIDLMLCGDIHKRQVFKLPNKRNGYMIGSLIQLGQGETIKHHGYGIYDVEKDEYTFIDIESERPYMHFKINDIKDIEDGKETLLNLG